MALYAMLVKVVYWWGGGCMVGYESVSSLASQCEGGVIC